MATTRDPKTQQREARRDAREADRRDDEQRVDELSANGHQGLEGAEQGGGVLHREGVEGGEALSIGGGPPSAAGGSRSPSSPTRDDQTD